jgi:predicted ester cyclase
MNSPDEALLEEHLAAENAHDIDRIMATFVASPVMEMNGTPIEGLEAVREVHRSVGFAGGDAGSFSELHVVERRRYRTGDAIVVEQTLSARHTGAFRDVTPTGRTISIALCTVYLFEGGRIAREHVYLDWSRVRHQLTRP